MLAFRTDGWGYQVSLVEGVQGGFGMTEGRWAEVVVRLAVFSTGMFSSKYPENVSPRSVR